MFEFGSYERPEFYINVLIKKRIINTLTINRRIKQVFYSNNVIISKHKLNLKLSNINRKYHIVVVK